MSNLPRGYDCPNCSKTNKFVPYVYAHWNDLLTHTCECGQTHSLLAGEVHYDCDLCGDHGEHVQTERCAGCNKRFCDDCGDWCHNTDDEPDGDYFCEECQE